MQHRTAVHGRRRITACRAGAIAPHHRLCMALSIRTHTGMFLLRFLSLVATCLAIFHCAGEGPSDRV